MHSVRSIGISLAGGLLLALAMACGGGGGGTGSKIPTSSNVLAITSTPPATAAGGVLYSYTLSATDSGGDSVTYQLTSGPAGAAITGDTLSWTPTSAQERIANSFAVTAVDVSGANSTPQSWSVSPTGTINGTKLVTYLSFNNGIITPQVPVTYPTPSISAVLPDGITTLPGTYNMSTGVYLIPNVPAGNFWLQNDGDWFWTSRSTVDLGWLQGGRQTVLDTGSKDQLDFQITGMSPWTINDYLVIYDYNSNIYINQGFANGTTSWIGGWLWTGWPLIDTTQGDSPQLIQMVDSILKAPTLHLVTGAEIYRPTGPVTMVNGTNTLFSGSFSAVPQTDTVYANFSRSQFAAYRSQYNPNGLVEWSPFIEFDSEPGTAYGDTGNQMDGLWIQDNDVQVTGDLNLGSVAAPALNPGFERIAYAGESYYVSAQLPGTSSAFTFKVRPLRGNFSLTPPDATHPIQPVLSPVQSPTINGASLFNNQTGVGLTPTIGWTAPSLGAPQSYKISVCQLSGAAGTPTIATQTHRLYLGGDQTSTTLPAGILTSGNTYCFYIRAYQDSTYDPTCPAGWRA